MKTSLAAIDLQIDTHSQSKNKQVVHLLPVGKFSGRDGRGPYINENSAAIVEETRRRAGRRQIPIDYDHQIDHASKNGKPAPAAGWITALQHRNDGIWGEVEWTPRAFERLKQREYRYLSPVIQHDERGKVFCLLRAALTNNPNLDQLTALASQEADMNFIVELKSLLSLQENADEAAILDKVRDVLTSHHAAAPDLTKFVPIGDFERTLAELNRVNRGVSLQAATDHVVSNINSGKLPPFLREWGVTLCSVNKPAFDEFIERAGGKIFNAIFGPSGASSTPPSMHRASELSDQENSVAQAMGLTETEFSKTKGRLGGAE